LELPSNKQTKKKKKRKTERKLEKKTFVCAVAWHCLNASFGQVRPAISVYGFREQSESGTDCQQVFGSLK